MIHRYQIILLIHIRRCLPSDDQAEVQVVVVATLSFVQLGTISSYISSVITPPRSITPSLLLTNREKTHNCRIELIISADQVIVNIANQPFNSKLKALLLTCLFPTIRFKFVPLLSPISPYIDLEPASPSRKFTRCNQGNVE